MLTAKQDNRLAAAETLSSVLTQNASVYANDNAMQAVAQRIAQLVAGLTPLRQQIQRDAPGTVAGRPSPKQAARTHLALVAAEVAGDVFGYATDQKNTTLQALADYSQSDFEKLRGSRLTDAATAIYNAAQDKAYKKDLQTNYDLTDDRLLEFKDAISNFDTLKTQPRETTIDGKTARVSLRAEFAELGTLLQDRLLRQMRKYKRRNKAFYDRVIAAREVIDRPGSSPAAASTPAA